VEKVSILTRKISPISTIRPCALPDTNQFYIGWTKDGQWCNYTVNVKEAGTYNLIALYACDATTFKFALGRTAGERMQYPAKTGGMHTWNKASGQARRITDYLFLVDHQGRISMLMVYPKSERTI